MLLHCLSTCHKLLDVDACASDWQKSYRSEDRETTTYVIRNNECLIAFLVGAHTSSTFLCVRYSNDKFLCCRFANLSFELSLKQTECEGCLGCCTRFRYIDDREFLCLEIFCKLSEIVLTDVIASEEHNRVLTVLNEPVKAVIDTLDNGTRTEV